LPETIRAAIMTLVEASSSSPLEAQAKNCQNR
jgi:hypothetical protein